MKVGLFSNLFKKKDDLSDLGIDFGKAPGSGGNTGLGMEDPFGPSGITPSSSQMPGGEHPAPGSQSPLGGFGSSPMYPEHATPSHLAHQPMQHQDSEKSSKDYMISKDIEVISSKIDALKAAIESINQRLANIERMAEEARNRRTGW